MIIDVWDLNGKYLGTGTQERVYGDDLPSWASEFSRLFGHPKITLENGTVLYGVECWWKEKQEAPLEQLDFKPFQEAVKSMIKQTKRTGE
ncbi:hypothetical protein KA005_60855 [bacterium]|nr:hypothetical protein [bacterium]